MVETHGSSLDGNIEIGQHPRFPTHHSPHVYLFSKTSAPGCADPAARQCDLVSSTMGF